MKRICLLVMLALSACGSPRSILVEANTMYPAMPEIDKTPGDYCSRSNPDFDETRYLERIPHCRRNVSESTKKTAYASYNVSYSDRQSYTVDHLIPLSFGGSNSIKNLWPQHKSLHTGGMEYRVFCLLRDGVITREVAVNKVLDVKFGRAPLSIPFASNCDTYAFGVGYAD